MNGRICRQVLDCGDGVREVTALTLAALKITKLAADTATATQSGDCADSVAAVQDALAATRFALGSWSRCVAPRPWRLPMNVAAERGIYSAILWSREPKRNKFRAPVHGPNARFWNRGDSP